jgi:lipopolysaccharide cholinephosphotransferase
VIVDTESNVVGDRSAPDGMGSLHRLLLHMLTELDRVSSKNRLRYFLTYGTLIGAVRERGFIGWDVDVDVFVPVDDYDSLCSALSAEISEDLCLYNPVNMPEYEHTFARIGFRGVDHKILRVDLLPLGRGPDGHLSRIAYAIFVRLGNLFYMLKLVPLEEKIHYNCRKRAITRFAKIPLIFIPSRVLLWAVDRVRRKQFAGTTLADSCGWFGGSRQFFDAAWFENTTRVEIEGQFFNAPIGTEPFLERVYGDFMSPISAQDQESELEIAYRYYVTPLRRLGLIDN